jgi:group I intron endonuclease
MNNYLIYKYTSPSGKAYIGQTKDYEKRCKEHKYHASYCRAFANAIKQYGWDNFEHEILHSNLTIDQANELEAKCILEHNTLSPRGYNLMTGGLNSVPSQETRDKLRLVHKDRIFTEKHKNKLSIAANNMSAEHKLKISIAKKNISAETRKKLSDSAKNMSAELQAIPSLAKKRNTFDRLQHYYKMKILTKDIYSATGLAKFLNTDKQTIYRHFPNNHRNHLGHLEIHAQQIHEYFNQPNPYLTL